MSKRQDAKLYVQTKGKGDAILLVHGALVDSDYFQETMDVFAKHYEVTRYDRKGYGRSQSKDNADYSIDAQAEEAYSIIQAIDKPCHLIAHSGGTTIALALASKHPECIRKIILHEPIDSSTPNQEQELNDIASYVHQGKYNKALNRFLPRLGSSDPRARKASDMEMEHAGNNYMNFIQNEFELMFHYVCDVNALKPLDITIGLGEQSLHSPRAKDAFALQEALNAKLIYFPGGHNGAYDLPKEFAYLCQGILEDQE